MPLTINKLTSKFQYVIAMDNNNAKQIYIEYVRKETTPNVYLA